LTVTASVVEVSSAAPEINAVDTATVAVDDFIPEIDKVFIPVAILLRVIAPDVPVKEYSVTPVVPVALNVRLVVAGFESFTTSTFFRKPDVNPSKLTVWVSEISSVPEPPSSLSVALRVPVLERPEMTPENLSFPVPPVNVSALVVKVKDAGNKPVIVASAVATAAVTVAASLVTVATQARAASSAPEPE